MGVSVAVIGADQAKYYTDAVAKGREDYYAGHGEAAPTEFVGRPDGIYEARREVSPDEAATIFQLGDEDKRKNVAFDITFSAPKSVSVLWALGDDETRQTIERAHRQAMESAVGSFGWYSRTGAQGVDLVKVDAPSVMLDFRHRTSRALDPQLHSHLLIENRVMVDGRPLTLDGREVFYQAKKIGMIYDAALRRSLTEELGVAWEATKESGASGDIRGVDKEVIALWSTRRTEIEAKLDDWKTEFEAQTGRAPSFAEARKAAEGFTLSTREVKIGQYSTEDLRVRWHQQTDLRGAAVLENAQAAAMEWAQAQKGSRAVLQNRLVGGKSVADPSQSLAMAIESGQIAAVNRYQLECEVLKFEAKLPTETPKEWQDRVGKICDEAIDKGYLVPLVADPLTGREERFTTPAQLEKEKQLVASLATQQNFFTAGSRLSKTTAQIAEQAVIDGNLSEEQAQAIRELADAKTTGALLIGAPGVGKTTALGYLAEAAGEAGWTVTGLASTGRASSTLTESTTRSRGNNSSSTIANWVGAQKRPAGVETEADLMQHWRSHTAHAGETPNPELIVLDEGSLTSTDDLAKIAAYAQFSQAKVVIVGDHKQIGSVEKGGILLGIATAQGEEAEKLGLAKIPTARIETVVRQREEWERRAAEKLRAGGKTAAAAVDTYAKNGRIHAVASPLEAKKEIARQMADDFEAGKQSLAIGWSGSTVNQLNTHVRQELINRRLVAAEPLPDFKFHTGQLVTTRLNVYEDKERIINNGDRWVVVGQEGKGDKAHLIVEKLGTSERRTITKEYAERSINGGGKAVQGGYATTPRLTQSMSINGSSYSLASEQADAASLLVPMTRGKEANHIYVLTGKENQRHDPLMDQKTKTAEVEAADWLKSRLEAGVSENQKSAIQTLAEGKAKAQAEKAAERATERAETIAKAAEKAAERERKMAQEHQQGFFR